MTIPLMRTAPHLSACEQWLQESLAALKRSATGSFRPAALDLPGIHEQLLQAICSGDPHQPDLVLQSLACSSPDQPVNVVQLVFPLIHQLENDWLTEKRNYSDTLQAFWNLQQWMERHLRRPSGGFPNRAHPQIDSRVLLSTAPGCEHNLGILAVSHFFQAQGLHAQVLTDGKRHAIVDALTSKEFDFLGLSVGHDAGLDGLIDFLNELRFASRNPRLRIFIGGNIFTMPHSEYAWIGADFLAHGPEDAFTYCLSVAQPKLH